jgi:hypothetical protein
MTAMRMLGPGGPRTLTSDQILAWTRESYFEHADAHRCTGCGVTHRMDADSDVCDCDGQLVPICDDGSACPATMNDCVIWLEAHALAIFDHHDDEATS